MKNIKMKNYLVITLLAVLNLVGCGLDSMVENAHLIKYKVLPSPLEVTGNTVKAKIIANFPANYFLKNALVSVTPVVVNGNIEVDLTKISLKGEAATGEGRVINFVLGGNIEHEVSFDYKEDLRKCDLKARIVATDGKKTYPFADVNLAKGTIVTKDLVYADEFPMLAHPKLKNVDDIQADVQKKNFLTSDLVATADMFNLSKYTTEYVKIYFDKAKDDVKSSQLGSIGMKDFKKKLDDLKKRGVGIISARIIGSASPEGPVGLNTSLSGGRKGNSIGVYKDILKKSGVKLVENTQIDEQEINENWDGFKAKILNSNLAEKDLILNILESYQDVNEREVELKKLTKTFVSLEKSILPDLRYSEFVIEFSLGQKSTEELITLAKNNPVQLNAEQLLFATIKMNDVKDQITAMESFVLAYPNDWRGYNNLGYYNLLVNNIEKATENFSKANNLSSLNAIVSNNLGVVYRKSNQNVEARNYYTIAETVGENCKEFLYNKAVIEIMDGNYEAATKNLSNFKTINGVLNQVLLKNYDGAKKLLNDLDPKIKKLSVAIYINAIIESNMDNADGAKTLLASLKSIDEKLSKRGETDLEFSFNR